MDELTQNWLWNDLSPESQELVRRKWKESTLFMEGLHFEYVFGKHNLQRK